MYCMYNSTAMNKNLKQMRTFIVLYLTVHDLH